jgi:hypothetical protein
MRKAASVNTNPMWNRKGNGNAPWNVSMTYGWKTGESKMETLKEMIKSEFGDLLTDSSINIHLIPVIVEWLQSNRMRKTGQDLGRRTSHDTAIDLLIERVKL